MEQPQTRLDPVDAMLRDMESPRKKKDPVTALLAPPPARGPGPTTSENVLGYINDIVMGATGGQSNKVNAAVNAAASKVGGLLTGEDVNFGEEYDKGVHHLYNRRKKHEKANPVSSGAATIAGALVPASKVAKVVDKLLVGAGAGLGKKILAQGAAGLGEGAIAGQGFAEPGKEWDGATMGGALGALTGSVAPILGHAVKRIVEKYFMGAKSPAIPAAAKAYITNAARDQGMSVDQFIAKYKELGDGATAYDTGQPMTMLAKTLTKTADDPGDAAGKAMAIREARRADQGSLLRTIDDNIAEAGKDVSVPIERSPAWAKVKATSVKIDDNLVDIMDRPSFRKAYAKAQEKALEEGPRAGNKMLDLDALIEGVRVAGETPGGGLAMSVGGLQKIKKALDKALEVDRDPFGKLTDNYDFEAMALRNNTRKEFVDWVKGKSPEYGKLLDADHKNFLLKDAREMGELFFSPKTQKGEKLAEIMGGLKTPPEKRAFQIGVADAFAERTLKNLDSGGDISKTILQYTTKLSQVFGKDGAESIKKEAVKHLGRMRRDNFVTMGSDTAALQQAIKAMGGVVDDLPLPSMSVRGLLGAAANYARGSDPVSAGVKQKLGELLFDSTPEALEKYLKGVVPPGQGASRLAQAVAPVVPSITTPAHTLDYQRRQQQR